MPRPELTLDLVVKPRVFINLPLDDDEDMMIPGFFVGGAEAERGLCINRKSTLNMPIVFIMQTTVNKLKKKQQLGKWEYAEGSEKA